MKGMSNISQPDPRHNPLPGTIVVFGSDEDNSLTHSGLSSNISFVSISNLS
jgi:hypothetical protein